MNAWAVGTEKGELSLSNTPFLLSLVIIRIPGKVLRLPLVHGKHRYGCIPGEMTKPGFSAQRYY